MDQLHVFQRPILLSSKPQVLPGRTWGHGKYKLLKISVSIPHVAQRKAGEGWRWAGGRRVSGTGSKEVSSVPGWTEVLELQVTIQHRVEPLKLALRLKAEQQFFWLSPPPQHPSCLSLSAHELTPAAPLDWTGWAGKWHLGHHHRGAGKEVTNLLARGPQGTIKKTQRAITVSFPSER